MESLETLMSSEVAALRSNWEFAAIIQFCRMFAQSLKLRGFSAELLESAVLDPDAHRVFLTELLYKLLRPDASQGYSEGDAAAWEHLLRRKLSAQWREAFDEHAMSTTDFFGTGPTTRVRRLTVLSLLCTFRLAGELLKPRLTRGDVFRCRCCTPCVSGERRSVLWSETR